MPGENDNLNVEAEAEQGAGGEPNPSVSGEQQAPIDGEAQKLFELLAGKFDERFNELTKPFLGQLEGLKKVQGDIDRSQNSFKEQLAQLNKYKAAGLSDEEAMTRMEQDANEGQWKTNIEKQLGQLIQLVSGGTPNQQVTAASVFQKYGLDPKDPTVALELAKSYKSVDEMEVAALRTFHKMKTSPSPTAAQQAALNGGGEQRRTNKKDISNINDSSALYDIAAEEILTGR